MHSSERLRLARATYRAAIFRARLANTPQTWQRLVRAGSNLREVEAATRPPDPGTDPSPVRERSSGRGRAEPPPSRR